MYYFTLIYSLDLLSDISLAMPRFNFRNPSVFKSNFHSTTKYGFASTLNRALRTINVVYTIVDKYHDTLSDVVFNLD